jgi:hypothetical protein
MREEDDDLGRRLFATVESYAALGDHRTGTAVDEATVDWFASELEALGARVKSDPSAFPRYDARWEVKVDGETVESPTERAQPRHPGPGPGGRRAPRAELERALVPFPNVRLPDGLPDPAQPPGRSGWIGESGLWARFETRLVSIAGGFYLGSLSRSSR